MTDNPHDAAADWEVERMYTRNDHAQHLAAAQIKRYALFHQLPVPDLAGNILLGWGRKLNLRPLTQREADYMLASDIRDTFEAINAHVFPLLRIDEARLSVVIHLCVLLGVENVKAMGEFWTAMRVEDYETAADQMLLGLWPRFVGNDLRDKERAVDIVHTMRTGKIRPRRRATDGANLQ